MSEISVIEKESGNANLCKPCKDLQGQFHLYTFASNRRGNAAVSRRVSYALSRRFEPTPERAKKVLASSFEREGAKAEGLILPPLRLILEIYENAV